jgi:hypothetical protein
MEPDAPISGRSPRVQTFACRAAPVGLGSEQSFAAIRLSFSFFAKTSYSQIDLTEAFTASGAKT